MKRGRPKKDLTGQRFGHLTALRPYRSSQDRGSYWLCRCDLCGLELAYYIGNLLSGNTKSCGCERKMTKRRTE